jgi:hypothetical protein
MNKKIIFWIWMILIVASSVMAAQFIDVDSDDFNLGDYSRTQTDTENVTLANATIETTTNNTDGSILLMHFNNDSSIGENATYFVDTGLTGNNGSCTTTSCPTLNTTDCVLGNCITLDGGDYIIIPDNSDWALGGSEFAMEIWLNPVSIGALEQIFSQWKQGGGTDRGWSLDMQTDGGPKFWASEGSLELASSINLVANTWSHVAVVRRGNTWTIYVNGVEGGSTSSSDTITNSATDVAIGVYEGNSPSSYFFEGSIDEFTIHNVSFTAAEIKEHYQSQRGGFVKAGNFTSQIFDSGSTGTTWDNITWDALHDFANHTDAEPSTSKIDSTSLVLMLHLNNDSTIGENATFFVDESTSANNATCDNSAGECSTLNITDTKFANSQTFDGGDCSSIPDSADWFFGTGDFSFNFWVNLQVVTGSRMFITQEDYVHTTIGYFAWRVFTSGGNLLRFEYSTDGGTGDPSRTLLSVPWIPITNTWYNIAVVRSGSDIKFYVDGVQQGTNQNIGTDNIANIAKVVSIGCNLEFGSPANFITGNLDEIQIYKRALSKQEILENYQRGALRLSLQARSCNDSACDGETFSDNLTNEQDISSLTANQYFQYKAEFSSSNLNYTSFLQNVTIDYTLGDTCTPPAVNNDWVLEYSDNCTLTSDTDLGTGDLIPKSEGIGSLTLADNVDLTTDLIPYLCDGCKIILGDQTKIIIN